MEKIKVSAVSYLNTKPYLFGLEQSSMIGQIDLSLDTPSEVAEKLIKGKATIGLVPTVVIAEIPNAQIISDYGICCDGEVGSVCIYSQVPIEKATQVYLDYQSRTSVELAKILLKDFWKVNPELPAAFQGYEKTISGNVAGLIIGDRALQLKNNFPFCYDLGRAWKDFTGLPFVFACWVSNRELSPEFKYAFNNALKTGVNNLATVARQNEFFYPGIDILSYLTQKVHFSLDTEKYKALHGFLSLLPEKNTVSVL